MAYFRVISAPNKTGHDAWVVIAIEPDGSERPLVSYGDEAKAWRLADYLNALEVKRTGEAGPVA
jgi:hypothetical protein